MWWQNLNPAQHATAVRIMDEKTPYGNKGPGWKVLVTPTVGPARHLELRHYFKDGGVARWVIERDGTVSATNDEGQARELIPVESGS